jgi:hypothetical protein
MKHALWPFACGALLFGVVAAHADAQGYCEDYARDMASNRMSGSAILTGKRTPVTPDEWAAANSEILADCLATFAAEPAPPPEKPVKKRLASAAVAPSQDDALKPGSKAWKDYCARKYVSFDPESGTYTGKSGTKRPCLVTKN